MRGLDVYQILRRINISYLHHANTVTTSCTFLEQGGLLSRGFVEDRGLTQTPQSSDRSDKEQNIWHSIFLDHVDIHQRTRRNRAPNNYGPVLFRFSPEILLTLPQGSEVRVTKENPIYWGNKSEEERWFQTLEELAQNIRLGTFGQMIVINTPNGALPFPRREAHIILDDPRRELSSTVTHTYKYAEERLRTAAAKGRIGISIECRTCDPECVCLDKYARFSTKDMNRFFR
jgi:hypothetical protein